MIDMKPDNRLHIGLNYVWGVILAFIATFIIIVAATQNYDDDYNYPQTTAIIIFTEKTI